MLKNTLLETFRDTQDPQENELSKFQTVIKQHESLVTAREFKGEVGGNVRRITEEPPKETRKPGHFLHRLCNKEHKRGECSQQCKVCKMKGNHPEENCWTLHPEKKPKFYTPKKDRKDKGRGRSRSKSVEKEEKRKGRENSPYPARVGRVTNNQLTDRDSDESENEASVKELERDYLEAKEKAKETKKKYEKQIKIGGLTGCTSC